MTNVCLQSEVPAQVLVPIQWKVTASSKLDITTKHALTVYVLAQLEAAVPVLAQIQLKDIVMTKLVFMIKSAMMENAFHHTLAIPVPAFLLTASKITAIRKRVTGARSALTQNAFHHAHPAHQHHLVTHANHGYHLAQSAALYQLSSTLSQNAPSVLQQLLAPPSQPLLQRPLLLKSLIQKYCHQPV